MREEKRVASSDAEPCRNCRISGLPKRALLLGLFLGVLPGGAQERGFIAPVALYAKFEVDPPDSIFSAVRDELADIMLPVGVRFEWRSLPKFERGEVAAQLAVVTFHGRCDLSDMTPLPSTPGVLGMTHVIGGAIIPFSDIDCDRIRRFIQRDLITEQPGRQEAVYGRAIARVLAHELYHILANTAEHGHGGLGKSTYSANDLVADDFPFEPRNLSALKNGKFMANLKNPAHARHLNAAPAGAASEAAH